MKFISQIANKSIVIKRALHRGIKNAIRSLALINVYGSISKKKQWQYNRYLQLKNKFENLYLTTNSYDTEANNTVLWKNCLARLEKEMLPYPPFDFLRNPSIEYTMFVNAGGDWLKQQISFLEQHIPENNLRVLLEEELMGKPRLIHNAYRTSHNTVHTLYHLISYQQACGVKFDTMEHVVEWGGGYGNMARIFSKINPDCTYVLIDNSMMACIQWLYLSTVIKDAGRVHLITGPGEKINAGDITIIPTGLLHHYEPKADLFISTWALSECPASAQKIVTDRQWFNALHILVAYQKKSKVFPDSEYFIPNLLQRKAFIQNIDFLPHNNYIFL